MKSITILLNLLLIVVSASATDTMLGDVFCSLKTPGQPLQNMMRQYKDGLFVLKATSGGVSAEVFVLMTCGKSQVCTFSLPTSIRSNNGDIINASLSYPARSGGGNVDSSVLSANMGTVTCSL